MRRFLWLSISLGALFLNAAAANAGVIVSTFYLSVGTLERVVSNGTSRMVWLPGNNDHWRDLTPAENLPDMSASSSVDYPLQNYKNKSTGTYAFHQAGNQAVIDFTWDHTAIGAYVDEFGKLIESEGYGFAAAIFKVDVDTWYTLSGEYAKVGNAAAYQYVEFYEDFNVDEFYVFSGKESVQTPDETLVLGSPTGGDQLNLVDGDFSGLLGAGRTYVVYSLNYIHAYDNPDSTRALGNLRLTLTEANVQAVPEPGSLALLAVGAVIVGTCHRRRSRGKREVH